MPDKQWWKCLSWKCTFHVIFRQFRRVACCWQSQQRSSARDVLSKGRTSGSAITQKGREGDLCSPAASQQARPLQLSLKEASLFHVSYFFFCFPFYRHFSWIFFHFFFLKTLHLDPSFLLPPLPHFLTSRPTPCCVSCLSFKQIGWLSSAVISPHLPLSRTYKCKNSKRRLISQVCVW